MSVHVPLEEWTVAEVMTADLLTIAADESVLMAWELMCRAGVHHLPVVDAEGGFLGVLDAQTLTASWDATGPRQARRPVTTLLDRRSPTCVHPADPVRVAAHAMLEAGGDHVAVTDANGALVGLITARDLIGILAGSPTTKAPQHSGMPSLYRIEPVLPQPAPAFRPRATAGDRRTGTPEDCDGPARP